GKCAGGAFTAADQRSPATPPGHREPIQCSTARIGIYCARRKPASANEVEGMPSAAALSCPVTAVTAAFALRRPYCMRNLKRAIGVLSNDCKLEDGAMRKFSHGIWTRAETA